MVSPTSSWMYSDRNGALTRSAVGLAELPFGIPEEIEGEVELYPE